MRPLQLRHRVRSARWRVRWRRHGDLRAILNGLPALVGYWDTELRNRMANDAYVEYFGLTPRQMRGMHIRDVLGPDLYAENAPYIAGALAGEPQLFDREIPTPSGQLRHTQASYVPDVVDGVVRGFFVLVTDITARREAEQARAAAEARFRALFESAPLGTFLSDAEGRILDVNPAGAKLLGATREQLMSRTRADLTHPDDIEASAEQFERLIAGEIDSYRLEKRYLHAEGRIVWAQLDVTALRDDDGRLVALAQVQDISERKRAEVAIRRAKEEAERANSAKSEFLSRMSHELRTPLHAILGFGELLALEGLSANQEVQIAQIDHAGRHLLELVNEVLDISHGELGELRLSLEPVHVGEVVMEALEMIEPLAAERSVGVSAAPGDALDFHVRADRQRLRQVLLNLLSNGVKYNRVGGEMRVEASKTGEARGRIEVSDTGTGIGADDVRRVFEPFERLGAEEAGVEGTGLGLALTKRLIEAMAGRIGVDSVPGSGTTFWFELPLVAAPAALQSARERAASPPAAPRAPGRARTVLYVEDNASNVRLVEMILAERPEITLLVARQGEPGVELAREHRPALILLDLNLPDISGEEVLRRVRGDARTAGIPVVVVTADATADQSTRLRDAGADAVLTKPFEIEQLLTIVDGTGTDDAVPAPASAGAPEDEVVLDPARIANLRRIQPDAEVHELLDLFAEDSSASLARLASSARAADAEAVERTAHAWKGACAIVGARRLVALLELVEAGACTGRVPDEQRIEAIERGYSEVAAVIARELG